MKMKRSGFVLIEFIVYLAILVSCVLLGAQLVLTSRSLVHRLVLLSDSTLSTYAAVDLFVRDVHTAHRNGQWYQPDRTLLIWQVEQHAVGWSFNAQKKRILRTIGDFDWKKQVWKKHTRALVLEQVVSVNIEPVMRQDKHEGVKIMIECFGTKKVQAVAMIKNGMTI